MAQFFKPKPKALDKKHQEILITRMDYQGTGIGQLGNLTTFVSGLLPTEKALVQLTQQKKKYAKAKLIKRLSDSELRREPLCPCFSRCGGCSLQYLSIEDQLHLKKEGLFSLLQRAVPQLDIQALKNDCLQESISGESRQYRRSARLSIFKGRIGFREEASKNIIDIDSCPVLVEPLDGLLPDLRELLLKMATPLGHVELIQADNTPVVYLRANKALSDKEKQAFINWGVEHSVSCYLAQNADEMTHLCGDAPFYEIDGIRISFMPRDFIQVNALVNREMVKQAIDWLDVGEQDRILDLFCGLGNFSLPLAGYAKQVVGVEGVDAMVERATANARQNGLKNASFYQANLEESIHDKKWASEGFNKVLLDPARAGASGIMSHIVSINPEKVLYVSCNPVSLSSDVKVLIENGYSLQKIGILNMFPHTGHIESMLLFSR